MDYCKILNDADTIAVVGISSNPTNTSRNIARYLVSEGFKVVGVNPNSSDDLMESIKIYKNLKDIPHQIDVVDVFRRSEDVADLIDDVLFIKPKTLWLQLGIINNDAMEAAKKAGINAVQDKCIYIEHKRCSSG